MTDIAPFYNEVAEGPDSVEALWVNASDGVRLRLAIWPVGARGTVFLLPGRTEYVEKYGRAAGVLGQAGYATISVDWRGQGLADRLLDDPATGHVMDFSDYQLDIAAMIAAAKARGLPQPYYLLAHSMGGCIGLRALMNGMPVKAAVFTAPMWGISLSPAVRPFAWGLSWAARHLAFGHVYAPGTKPKTYVEAAPFGDNQLTTDPEMYAYMQRQVSLHPELALGGPSLRWLYEGLLECRRMAQLPPPPVPTLTFLGTRERIVDTPPIHQRMTGWDQGQLEMVKGAEHEVMMELAAIRDRAFAQTVAHFAAHR